MANQDFERFLGLIERPYILDSVSNVLAIDEETQMPGGEGPIRARQKAIIEGLQHELLTSNEIGRLIENLLNQQLFLRMNQQLSGKFHGITIVKKVYLLN